MRVLSQLSGGLDSAASTLKVAYAQDTESFQTIFYDIGQPYVEQERAAAEYVVAYLNRIEVPYYGHYEFKIPLMLHQEGDVPSEYIPVRNLVLGTHSANVALAAGYDAVAVGSKTTHVRTGDPYSFADCSIEFFGRLTDLARFCSEEDNQIKFTMPLINKDFIPMTKREVIIYLQDNSINLKKLWSCYRAEESYCGNCYHCEEIKKTGLWHYFT